MFTFPRAAQPLMGSLRIAFTQPTFKGFSALLPRYLARFSMKEQRVRVSEIGGTTLHGLARGIGEDGALELTKDDGQTVRVIAGDVTLVRPEVE